MRSDDVRESYLKFFESKGHVRLPSDSLVPSNDPSLLFTSAGMAPFKDMFLGIGKLPHKRVTTCQKCLRVGDLENVGRTTRHHTFFEMLGNFSFGDYFKADAIEWCWGFYHKTLGISAEKLWISVYEKDDEAVGFWTKLGVLKNPIVRMGEADNFWPANAPSQGPNGPCGPCSEMYYDFGKGPWWCGKCDKPGCNCDRFVEIGNIVFTGYERLDGGVLKPLPKPNIDFGGGLERVSAVMQGVHSNFEIDTFRTILRAEEEALHHKYEAASADGRRFRRIADHIRSLTFCIADEARPGNEGRGYVVRRILRTAFRDGWKLGAKGAFLHTLVSTVVDQMRKPYPYLAERRATIEQTIKTEEEHFLKTIERGLVVIEGHADRLKKAGQKSLGGKEAFDLYQSHGFPIELTVDVLTDHGIEVDRDGFKSHLEVEQNRARTSEAIFDPNSPLTKIKEQKVPSTKFLGYEIAVADIDKPVEVTVQRIVKLDGDALAKFNESKKDMAQVSRLIGKGTLVETVSAGDLVAVLCDRTPFYGEGGGQIGDSGWIEADGATVEFQDCRKPDGYFFHIGSVKKGSIKTGQKVRLKVDADRRLNIMRNHTGTHLLQAALRAVLGPHVTQAGSVVEPDRLRFDFTHPKALTPEEKRKVEDWVNKVVMTDHAVTKVELSMEEAKAKGAIMFFGDKYGDRVRVVSVGPALSVELCGGTHLERSSTISQLRITSESAIGSGVRRVEAVTGPGAVEVARQQADVLGGIAAELGCPIPDLPKKIHQLVKDVQELKGQVGQLKKGAGNAGFHVFATIERNADGILVMALNDAKPDDLRDLSDRELQKHPGLKVGFFGSTGGAFIIKGSEAKKAFDGLKAKYNLKGGGRPDMVQGSFPAEADLKNEGFWKTLLS